MAKKLVIPWELKYDFAMKGWINNHKGVLYNYESFFTPLHTYHELDFCKVLSGKNYKYNLL